MNISRRGFLASIGAGVAGLSTSAGYRKLIPFVSPVEDLVPGVATWYASGCRECPAGCGVLLRNREARVVKAEGNPLHPVNAGRLCGCGQASLQGLYNPDRLARPKQRVSPGEWKEVPWETALAEVGKTLAGARRIGFISDLQSGSLAHLIRRWLRAMGGSEAGYLVYEPLNYESLRIANEAVFGVAAIPDYRTDRCDFLISFGADFLETWLSPVQLTRRFTDMRKVRNGKRARFVYVGPRRSPTATQADEVILLPPGDDAIFAQALVEFLGTEGAGSMRGRELADRLAGKLADPHGTLARLAGQIRGARAPLALAGSPLPAGESAVAVATAAQLLNQRSLELLDFGRAHSLGETATGTQQAAFLRRAEAGEYDAVVILNANPVYSMPPALKASAALGKVKAVVCLNSFADETVGALATWALPINAPAESWGDYQPARGVTTLMQPAMGSTFDAREAGDVLLLLARAAGVQPGAAFGAESYYDYLRGRWREIQRAAGNKDDFETFWRASMEAGGLAVEVPAPAITPRAAEVRFRDPRSPAMRLHLYPSIRFLDGRHANKAWLQEIPDPMTGAVWGSWVELHPETAGRLHIATGDQVEIATASGKCELPAHVWDGVAPDTAALALGQGHTEYGRYATGVGVNALALLSAAGETGEVTPRKLNTPGDHVVVHGVHDQHGREIALAVALKELKTAQPEAIDLPLPEGYQRDRDVYRGHDHPDYRWAMAVDLDKCNGCGACVAACYAENNIPVVGTISKNEVRRSHEMPWLRIDRYEERDASGATRVLFQPLMCQQCDSAPCESVCPAYATVHSPEGLNEQIYNRCVGTRYCNNNCPYKTRRFNWFNFEWPEPLNYQLNPDVTVRERGVMEKCTFCVQRIREATIKAKAEGRTVTDGEITPACVQTCPAGAFVFGDLKDPDSRIARVVATDPRRYQVLRELNTKPAVFYLKRIVG